jgi:hypothetical protein
MAIQSVEYNQSAHPGLYGGQFGYADAVAMVESNLRIYEGYN